MIKIAICDDEELPRKQLGNLVSEYCSRRKIENKIFYFSTGYDLLEKNLDDNFSFIFLDIDLGEKNGVEIAKKIRNMQITQPNIVFVTGYEEFMNKVLSIHTFDYILKPIDKNRVTSVLDDLVFWYNSDKNKTREKMRFKTIDGVVTLYLDEILYFEYKNRRIDIITLNNIYHMYSKMKDIAKLLKKFNFCVPHAAYVVNLAEIDRYMKNDNQIFMSNNEPIPISQLKARQFKKEYIHFLSNIQGN